MIDDFGRKPLLVVDTEVGLLMFTGGYRNLRISRDGCGMDQTYHAPKWNLFCFAGFMFNPKPIGSIDLFILSIPRRFRSQTIENYY
jgi:hypothetical protein